MSDPVTVTIHMLEHRIDHDQWCTSCLTDAAVTAVVTCVTNSGVSTATKTACPRCGAGLTPKEQT